MTSFVYDACNQLVETEYADQARLTYALDALGRVTGVTSPNGNQSDLDSIVLEGAKNALFNPSGQEPRPFDLATWTTPNGDLNPRYWKPNSTATRDLDGEGQAYFPLTSTVNTWEQKNVPASAGCRYLAHFQARKEDSSGGTTTARMEFQYRLHKDFPATTHTVLSSTVEGAAYGPTTQDWEESTRSRLDIPGDTQASLNRPAIASARLKLVSGSNPLGVRNLQLQRLSTCFEFDGENLREVCFPDGARQRTEYDRLGRAFLTRDPDGRTILREFDALDRVVHVVDSLGNELFFDYNDKMDLVLFRLVSQGVNQDTEFEWDALHRLKTILYHDATTELFDYSAGGDLTSYTDNLSQERVYHYDALHRLDLITYPDTTTVALTYDKVGNLLSTLERDSKGWDYSFDALNRLTGQQYTGQTGLTSEYNETGQRMSLNEGGVYGIARYGASSYGTDPIWSVPSNGRDEVGRLLIVEDVNADTTEMIYDVDGRCTQIDHQNTLSDLMSYDIVGKLLSKVVQGSSNLLEMRYGYSLAGDRIAQQTDLDTFTYLTDAAGRLVEESHNRFCIHQPAIWKQGEWDRLTFDAATQSMQLLPYNDDLSGTELALERWTLETRQTNASYAMDELDNVGLELRHNDGLRVAYPRAFHNQAYIHRAPVDNAVGSVCASYGGYTTAGAYPEELPNRVVWIDLRHDDKLVGDFDISVDYQDFQGFPGGDTFWAQLAVSPNLLTDGASSVGWLSVRLVTGVYTYVTFAQTTSGSVVTKPGVGLPAQGQIRMTRSGSTFEAFVRAQGASTWTSIGTYTGITDDLYVYLSFLNSQNSGSVQFSNFQRTGDALASEGVFLSPIYDAGRVVSWDRIQWTENLPSGCDIELEIALADNYEDFEDFVSPPAFFGPTGGGNFTTPAGQALPTGKTGRYAMVRATLTGNGTDTPSLSDIQLTCNAGSDTGSRVRRFLFDEAGNILRITTTDDLGVSEDVRDDDGWSAPDRINSLNQIMRQDVGGDTWSYSWDLNGNLTEKTDGVDTWTYTWDTVENRLLRVQGPGSIDVNYTWDMAGRMLTRDDGTDVTTFTWDGFDMIRETTGMSTTTYCIPEGQLSSFIRDGDRFDCHLDALASVRLVTDDNGDVVARFETDAWGNQLASSFDNVPGGMPYSWVGGLGVRFDADSGLWYMRQRWYDPTLQRFISRDPIGLHGGANLYRYCANSPTNLVDPSGLRNDERGLLGAGTPESQVNGSPTATMTTLGGASRSSGWGPFQEGALLRGIDLAAEVDPALGARLNQLYESGDIQAASELVSRFAGGFTPGSKIYLDPKYVKSGRLDKLTLASLLAHEAGHIDQSSKNMSIMIYLMTSMYDSYSLEINAYKKQLKFLLKLRNRYCHDSPEAKQVELEILEVERRIRNLGRYGNIDGKHL